MTGVEARAFVIHGRLDDAQTLKAVREILMKIGSLAGFTNTAAVSAGAPRTLVDLPADFLRVKSVRDDRDKPYYRYQVARVGNGFQIAFDNAGTYQVLYVAKTPEYLDVAEEIPVHEVFDASVIEYLKGYAMLKENPNSAAGNARIESAVSLAMKARAELNQNSAKWGVRGR